MNLSNYRWFETSELDTEPDAPKVGDLVWIYYAWTKIMSTQPYTLEYWQTDAETVKRLKEKGYGHERTYGWRAKEQAFKHYLQAGDRVSRVLIPEQPQL